MRIVLVTPSYAPDFERCRLMCESVQRFVSSYDEHLLVVDRRDIGLFRALEAPRTVVVAKEEFLPWWITKAPFLRKWWLSLKTLPVRGWILQQVVKLSVAQSVPADVCTFVDSDTAFVRPYDASTVVTDGTVRLRRMPRKARDYECPRHRRWYRHAARMFRLSGDEHLHSDYIGQLVTWRADTVRRLCDHIETVSGRGWREELCGTLDFSEYTLYGIFCEFVLRDGSGHHWDDTERCHNSWDYDISTDEGMSRFLSEIRPEHVAILIQSCTGRSAREYERRLRELQDSLTQAGRALDREGQS